MVNSRNIPISILFHPQYQVNLLSGYFLQPLTQLMDFYTFLFEEVHDQNMQFIKVIMLYNEPIWFRLLFHTL